MRRRLQELVETFRQKGAISPEKAMTIQELGLPPRFEEAMHRRLGRSGIFVEVNGKYYLNETRLKQIQEERASARAQGGGSAYGSRGGSPTWTRSIGIFLMLPIGLIVALFLIYLFAFNGVGFFPGEILLILVIVIIVMTVARLLFWRSRRRYWQNQMNYATGSADTTPLF